jgi:hypothetical protein
MIGTGTTDLSCAFRRAITQIQVGCRTDIPAHCGDVCVSSVG